MEINNARNYAQESATQNSATSNRDSERCCQTLVCNLTKLRMIFATLSPQHAAANMPVTNEDPTTP